MTNNTTISITIKSEPLTDFLALLRPSDMLGIDPNEGGLIESISDGETLWICPSDKFRALVGR